MHIDKNHILTEGGERPIRFDRYQPEDASIQANVIFCHGYKGFKDWGGWHLVAEAFAQAGFAFWKFNFSYNGGTMDNPIDFPDLEAFALNNYSLEVEDLGRMIDMVRDESPNIPIYVIGHSRGVGIALLRAAADKRISKVVSWAGVSDFKARFFEGSPAFEQWKKEGVTYVENSRTKQKLPHKWQFYEDFIANEDKLTISKAVASLEIPQLIVHGNQDPSVPFSEGEALHRWNPTSQLEIIEGADHVFGMKHPWDREVMSDHMKDVVQRTINFLRA
jgi:pimeloyl-ACP methyl ester carboxylesterase